MTKVLITGGTGSFGQAFTEHLLGTKVERIVIYSRGEHAQEEMARQMPDPRLRFFVGDVRDRKRLELAMDGIDTVVHAAALKIVPIAEYNPTECIATNIGGAENVVLAAIASGVSRVIALSTDKAVNPINLYGASKLAAEKVFIAANNLSAGRCKFSVVRYGNVVGSRGSVLPFFKNLIATGATTLPLTDDRMTRFWITMQQAIEMVNTCHKLMRGREVYVPKIPSACIRDLIIALGCDFKIIGIRPGEKIHETLISEDEAHNTMDCEDYFVINGTLKVPTIETAYKSDTNPDYLNIDGLRRMLNGTATKH